MSEVVTLREVAWIASSIVDPTVSEFASLPHISAEHITSVTGELQNIRTAVEDGMESGKYLFDDGDVLYSKLRPYLRKAAIVNFRGLCSADMYPIKTNPLRLVSDYLRALLVSNGFTEYANEASARSRMPKLNREQLFAYQFKLPSIERQRCITSKFQAQLAAVEEARQAAQAQTKEVEALRWAIYRELEDELLKSYRKSQFGEWIASFRNGFGTRPKNGETGPIVLRIADVSSGTIRLDNPRRGEVSKTQARTYRLSSGDLLFVRVNGAREIVGRCCVVDGTLPSDTIFNDHLIRVQLKAGLSPVFARLAVSLPSARAKIEEAASTSAGQLTVNQEILSSIPIPMLPFDAQVKIATTTESRLATLQELDQGLQARMTEIDNLPTRLLAQAFEGYDHATS